jgi:hypothetical protein
MQGFPFLNKSYISIQINKHGRMKAYEFLIEKGINKVHQPNKRYNLTVYELLTFLEEYAQKEKASSYSPYELRAYKNIS